MDDAFFDDNAGRLNLSNLLPNSNDSAIKYMYARDSIPRAVTVDWCITIPEDQVQYTERRNENGCMVDCESNLLEKLVAGEEEDTSTDIHGTCTNANNDKK